MKIDFRPLKYRFHTKPLMIGGKAMEYYGLRKAGADIDFVISARDYQELSIQYPEQTRDIFGDLGICVHEFELWKSICLFSYDFLAHKAIEQDEFRVVSLERLLFLKTLGISEQKYDKDVRLIVKKILNIQYGKDGQFGAEYFS